MKTKFFVVLALFAAAWSLTFFCRVERHAQASTIRLSAIPTVIGEWAMVSQNTSLGAKEETFLDDVLVRTYQRSDGKAVQLAIVYGADQRKNFSIHMPELCYKAAGCTVISIGHSVMNSPNLCLKQVLAKNPNGALEAVQYWIVLDGKVVRSDFEQKLKHAYYGFLGVKAGGILVRVSSLTAEGDYLKNYDLQKEFIRTLYQSSNIEFKKILFVDYP